MTSSHPRRRRLRYPVTITFLMVLAAVGLATGSAWQRLPHLVIHQAGFRPSDALAFDLGRLLGAAWFTTDPVSLAQALVLTALGVGWLERRAGSVWAATAFVGLHLASFLGVVALYLMPFTHGLVRDVRDVGASAGYFGALAVVVAMTPRWRWLAAFAALAAVGAWLGSVAAQGVLGRDVNAAAEHAVAWLLGGTVGWIAGVRQRARTQLAQATREPPAQAGTDRQS